MRLEIVKFVSIGRPVIDRMMTFFLHGQCYVFF